MIRKKQHCAVIVAAGGRGERLGLGEPKALVPIGGRPLIQYCLEVFQASALVDQIIVAAHPAVRERVAVLGRETGMTKMAVVSGGGTRRESVARGLQAVASGIDYVAVHDAARPVVEEDLLVRLLEACRGGAAGAIAAARVIPTIKRVDPEGRIEATLDRDRLREAQTPQVFRRAALERAHKAPAGVPATDDAFLVERLGLEVRVVEAGGGNVKVTTREDLEIAEALLRIRGRLAEGGG